MAVAPPGAGADAETVGRKAGYSSTNSEVKPSQTGT